MYFIHPGQINVKLPCDSEDNNLALDELERPISDERPTGTSYLLQRVRLAHICREIVDMMPATSNLQQVPYSDIILLDHKLTNFINRLPFYFKSDLESRQRSKAIEAINPNLTLLRFCITRAAHSRRIKLHQRFLLRQSLDPQYAYSRHACLESARSVIQFYEGLAGNSDPFLVTARMGLAMHYMHLALVVLVMDLCVNRVMADEAEIKAEVKAGLRIFDENGSEQYPLLSKFSRSLQDTLRKHDVWLSNSATAMESFRSSPIMVSQSSMLDSDFDEFWQSLMQGDVSMDLNAWDSAFSDMDSRPL